VNSITAGQAAGARKQAVYNKWEVLADADRELYHKRSFQIITKTSH